MKVSPPPVHSRVVCAAASAAGARQAWRHAHAAPHARPVAVAGHARRRGAARRGGGTPAR